MKIGIFISTPAQYHFYKNIVMKLVERGNEVKILYRDYGETLEVSEVKGEVFSRVKTNWDRIIKLPADILRARKLLKNFRPEVITGFEIYAPYTAKVLGTKSFVFYDSEPRTSKFLALQMRAYMPFVDAILTPYCYLDDLGGKHLRIDSFKELAYLHPKYFQPDKGVLEELGVEEGEYAVLRFNAFDAAHDIGVGGFSYEDKVEMVKKLNKNLTVFVSAEGEVPKGIENYLLPVSKKKIHHVLYFARLLVTDTQTMATEAAILGTPTIRSNRFVNSKREMGNFIELQRLGLLMNFENTREAMERAFEISVDDSYKREWKKKRMKLIENKVDISEFMCWFIESYPESLDRFREKPEIQYRFR
ncbi:DUF354 domain-containing protein [Archaeoglobus neptunius]|uniref:DUF354 domain-containing protein n=1 Tax=Archaeoglobus neptunius TaxID=2798580 RepID=UPI00192752AD|nr:DUF354 domain-containing protein [Archaeoglobus neptunius]